MSEVRIFVGIDPGISGAVSVLDYSSGTLDIECHDTPCWVDANKRTRIDISACALLLRDISYSTKSADYTACHVFIEKVHASPQMGVTSAFSFGQGYGMWLGILAAFEIPHTLVSPRSWKTSIMPGEAKPNTKRRANAFTAPDKDASRIVAKRLWPKQTEEWLIRKKDVGRAEALLIAEWGRRTLDARSGILEE